ncbi:MAG TPA: hypothetical protein VHL53_06930, partial [Acidimicrobiia bacterium]|nr:hypothetical protein [Acidimicrobiia bacterium]
MGWGATKRGFVAAVLAASVVLTAGPSWSADRNAGAGHKDRAGQEERAGRDGRTRHPRRGPAPGDGAPARFVAESGGRIVIVSAETGRIDRRLTADQPGGGAEDPTVSPDGRTVWFSRGDGECAAHIASVPLSGGGEVALPGSGEAGPEGLPLPRPGRAQLAYSRTDCNQADHAVVVGDVKGLEGHGQLGLLPLAWNRAGDRLLAVTPDGATVHQLGIDVDGSIIDDTVVGPADRSADCRLRVVAFSPDDNDGYVAERRCGPDGAEGRRSLVLLDRTGAYRQTVIRLHRGQDFADRLAFDPSGHSLLYSTTDGAGSGATL